MTDPISDMLTRIRNAQRALLPAVELPHSKIKESIAHILKKEGYVSEVAIEGKFPKAIKLKLKRRGQTLPTNQQVVFPDSLSCHDTKTTMTCNQDFGLGVFKLAPKGSRGS